MPEPTKVPYHLAQQYAYALLGPICLSIEELEERTQSYLDHLSLKPADRAALEAAREALAAARAEVARQRQGVPRPRG
jgi:hypothetical protein